MSLKKNSTAESLDASKLSWHLRERKLLASFAMFSIDSQGRAHAEPLHPYRSPYQRDHDRILHSAAFRRLSGKMQVFTGEMGDYHRTRLTHTNEVASLARTVGRHLQLNEDLIEALALVHDIGHPPFGHCGEEALDECAKDCGGFSHNRFALEIIEHLEQRHTMMPGLNLTREVLAGQQHRSRKHDQPSNATTPLLEVQLVDLVDSIAYDSHDVDDALQLALIDHQQLNGLGLVRRSLEQARLGKGSDSPKIENQRQYTVHALLDLQVDDAIETSSEILAEVHGLDSQTVRELGIRLHMSPTIASEKEELETFLFDRVYRHPKLMEIRQRAATRLSQLFHLFVSKPDRLPPRFRQRANEIGVKPVTAQFLAGMTDRFCDDTYVNMIEIGRLQADDWI